MSLNEAAKHFNVSRRSLERYISDGRIPAYKLGRLVRVKISEIEASLVRLGSA
ncbi:helix-turn-helix domain-containing protein [Corynebacterium casei]|uniref:helix-turn-helix domain-containing protein n=1 Tax=Corynebacterium casei TaxID=160386 RepID=UPI003FD10698